MDIRERKLFKDDKDVKKPQENFYDFREKLDRFNPPSEATVTDFAPLKKATTASDFVDKHIVEQEDENPEPSNALEFVLQQLHTHKKEIEKYPKKKYLIAETFTAEFALQPFTGSPFISFENWFTKFDYSLAFVQIPPSPQQKLGRLLYHLQGAAKLAYEEYDDDQNVPQVLPYPTATRSQMNPFTISLLV
uniref:Uncharacterized protein n=1 Tax=Panagrolaimus superbus TaxID=310955 RepID=A0A914YNL9_9BILA